MKRLKAVLEKQSQIIDYRLAAIDLDGTLIGPDLKISSENIKAVERLVDFGLEVAIVTGRHFRAAEPFARQLPAVRWLVSAQGGEVCDVERREVLLRDFLPEKAAEILISLCSERSITPMLYGEEGVSTSVLPNEETRLYERLIEAKVPRLTENAIRDKRFFKVVLNAEAEAIDGVLEWDALRLPGTQLVRTHARFLEVTPASVSKATGLARLAERLGLSSEEVVSFGDAENDIPMFEWSGASYAMDHGWPRAKEAARWITPDGKPETAFARAVSEFFVERGEDQ